MPSNEDLISSLRAAAKMPGNAGQLAQSVLEGGHALPYIDAVAEDLRESEKSITVMMSEATFGPLEVFALDRLREQLLALAASIRLGAASLADAYERAVADHA